MLKIPKWQKELVDQILSSRWDAYLHPTFAPFCRIETVETETRCIRTVYKFIDKINRCTLGNRYKKRKIKGITSAWSLEYAEKKGFHLHLLIGNLPKNFPLENLYKIWTSLCSSFPEAKGTPIVRADSKKNRAFNFAGQERYWVRAVSQNQNELRKIASYLTKNCDTAQHRIWL